MNKCCVCSLIKISGAVVIAVAVAAAAYAFGSAAVAPRPLEKSVYIVEVAQPVVAAASSTDTAAASAAIPAAPVSVASLPELLAKADAAAGQKFAKICATCHSFNKGEPAKMGPNLYGIIGARHAHMDGFAYSPAMKALADKVWDFDELNAFLTDPRGKVPGTKMTYAGIKNDADRANVLAWLRTLADQPEPFPVVK